MMQENLPKRLNLSYSKDVFDIVQFGSSVLVGIAPNDFDVAVIFFKIPLKEQLEEAQRIKRQIETKTKLQVHIKAYDLYSFFDKSNFAKEGILFYGKSVISGEPFAMKFSLSPKLQIHYNLSNLKKKDKVKFNYLLNGKQGEYGLLRKYGGKILRPGLVEISPEHEKIFIGEMKKITSELELRKVLEV